MRGLAGEVGGLRLEAPLALRVAGCVSPAANRNLTTAPDLPRFTPRSDNKSGVPWDPINLIFIGTSGGLDTAFAHAGWRPAHAHTTGAVVKEVLAALAIRPDGLYLDGTFGRGGHAAEILNRLGRDGRLLATFKDGRAHLNAYLDDHAFLIAALIELLQARFSLAELEFAEELAEVLLDQFEDRAAGGFYFTARDHERLIHRPKPLADEAIPSGNGIAARALARLAVLPWNRYPELHAEPVRAALARHERRIYVIHGGLHHRSEESLQHRQG